MEDEMDTPEEYPMVSAREQVLAEALTTTAIAVLVARRAWRSLPTDLDGTFSLKNRLLAAIHELEHCSQELEQLTEKQFAIRS
jgi:hypothetical protein